MLLRYFSSHSQLWRPKSGCPDLPAIDQFDGSSGTDINNRFMGSGHRWSEPDLGLELDGSGSAIQRDNSPDVRYEAVTSVCENEGVLSISLSYIEETQIGAIFRRIDENNYFIFTVEGPGPNDTLDVNIVEISGGSPVSILSGGVPALDSSGNPITEFSLDLHLIGENMSVHYLPDDLGGDLDIPRQRALLHRSSTHESGSRHGFSSLYRNGYKTSEFLNWSFLELEEGGFYPELDASAIQPTIANSTQERTLVRIDEQRSFDGETWTCQMESDYCITACSKGSAACSLIAIDVNGTIFRGSWLGGGHRESQAVYFAHLVPGDEVRVHFLGCQQNASADPVPERSYFYIHDII